MKFVRPKTDEEMLREHPRRARTSGWFIRVEEVSAGHYVVIARDRVGHEVTRSGGERELERMIEECDDMRPRSENLRFRRR